MSFPSPSLTPPTLQPYQFSYNGLVFGAGTNFSFMKLTGLGGAPIRSADMSRPREQGEFIGLDLLAGRDVGFDLWVKTDGTSVQHAMNALGTALVVGGTTEAPLWFQLPNQPAFVVMCRPRPAHAVQIDSIYGAASVAKPIIGFHAVDPRIYATPTQSVTVGLPTPGTGLTFNASFNVTFGGASSGGLILAANAGNLACPPIFIIQGPCTNPRIQNLATGAQLAFAITLGNSDSLTIDTDVHSVLLNGTAARRNALVAGSSWFSFLPNATTQVGFFSGDPGVVAGTLTAQWASAYASAA